LSPATAIMFAQSVLLSLLAAVSSVHGHGHVSQVIANGVTYPGAIPGNVASNSVGWAANNLDNGFVEPNAAQTSDIACHKGARAATNFVKVAAGQSVTLRWNTWPDSHKGPVIDYLAPFNTNAGSLSFAKIAQQGLISGSNPGRWAADNLITNGNSWTVTIPSSVAPGQYVLRHEIIALHSANNANGAQFYPQCINIEVTSGGSTRPSGSPATSFYRASDPGVLFNLYTSFSSYSIPGPSLFNGGGSQPPVQQPPTTQPPTNPGGGNCAALFGQCGGNGWSGPTCCQSGRCVASGEWYSQCVN
jgi:cellulase